MANNDSRSLTVNQIIDDRPLSRFQITTITLCGVVLLLDGFDAQSMGFLAPPIAQTLGIPVSTFGPVFAAALVGLMIGTMLSGPVADRWGRKWPVILSTLTFGVFSIFTAQAADFSQLVIFRFLTGIGLGGAMPNVVSIATEYAPRRLQPVLVAVIFCGIAIGALVAGLVSSVMIPMWGWQSVFYLGGIAPILTGLLLIKVFPESVRFLTVRGADPQKVSRILGKIDPELTNVRINPSDSESERHHGIPVKYLFTEGRLTGTLLLWIPFFMNLLIIYFILSWLPALLQQAGMPISAGITAVSLFSLGGIIGVLLEGRWLKAFGAHKLMLAEFSTCMILIAVQSFVFESFALMMTLTFFLGIAVQGAQAGLNVLASMFYPTSIRSTGVGWALGIGRIGSIVGPVIGGMMLSLQWMPQQIFMAGALPALCAAVAVVASTYFLRNSPSPYRMELGPPGRGYQPPAENTEAFKAPLRH